jgi:NADPH-dependent glutamate synthase beta subunit-like oxidoreductase
MLRIQSIAPYLLVFCPISLWIKNLLRTQADCVEGIQILSLLSIEYCNTTQSYIIAMAAKKIRRAAVIGAGPAGAITTDALVKEQAFDTVRVFERQEVAGGTW